MKKSEYKECLVYLGIWVLLFLSPIISMGVRTAEIADITFNWHEVFRVWKVFVPYLIVFLIHNFLVAPLFIHRKKGLAYVGLTLCMVAVFQVYTCSHRPSDEETVHRPGFGQMPPERHTDMPPEGPRTMAPHEDGYAPAPPRRHLPPKDFDEPPIMLGQQDLVALIVMVLMLGMNLGVKLYFKNSQDAKTLEELEHKNLEQQLEYLKYQVNPHFFMNTLNNIHALVDIEPEEAKNSIVELSKMMRYVLYEGAKSSVPLNRDLDFIGNYITLMRLRYTDRVRITVDIDEHLPDTQVPPMIFITFVENAFKHGVSYRHDSFIRVTLKHHGGRLLFDCENSVNTQEKKQQGGVGLVNTRRRLDLIYGSDYKLDIRHGNDTYAVRLDIPVSTGTAQ